MKFQCERCKTRYSIADEKVRGKILKIRCKTCEAVITVREDVALPKLAPEPAAVGTPPKGRSVAAGTKSPTKSIEIAPPLAGGHLAAPEGTASVKEWFLA